MQWEPGVRKSDQNGSGREREEAEIQWGGGGWWRLLQVRRDKNLGGAGRWAWLDARGARQLQPLWVSCSCGLSAEWEEVLGWASLVTVAQLRKNGFHKHEWLTPKCWGHRCSCASYLTQGKVQHLWLLVSSCLVCSWQRWPRIEGQWACFLFGLVSELLVLRGKSNAQNFNCKLSLDRSHVLINLFLKACNWTMKTSVQSKWLMKNLY